MALARFGLNGLATVRWLHMGDAQSATAERSKTYSGDVAATAKTLTRRHFVLQDRRPEHLADVDLVAMDPYLRGLLFTDGTVTRTLEVQTFSPVSVEVVNQSESTATGLTAEHLRVPATTMTIRRRVRIGLGEATTPVIWAESHIAPSRLPPGFLAVLGESPDGIGESLQQVRLESCREMLWFGIDSLPRWGNFGSVDESKVLRRLYRVIARGRPAMLISESFAIRSIAGVYHLAL